LRARLRRLEVENENTNLRARIDQLEVRRASAPREATTPPPAPQRLEASAPDRTLILADMNFKAPPAIAPRLYSWTGFYVGANIGYGLGDDPVRSTMVINNGFTNFSDPANIAPAGAIGGVQLGYNWQGGSNWLVGFEADFQASAQKGITCIIQCIHIPAQGTDQVFSSAHKIDYFGTVRGRIGWVNNNALFYVTGGGAYGRVEQTDATFFALPAPATGGQGSGVSRQNKFGYVVGGGAEASLGGNWTGKIEYLYMDFGTIGASSNTVVNLGAGAPLAFTLATDSRVRDNIFRIGVNYRVNGDPAPLSAYAAIPGPAAPIYSWTGFYAGANVGGIIGNDRISQVAALGGGIGTVTTEPTNIVPKGVLGGVQVGYNYQAGPRWLAGFEADFQGSNQSATSCAPFACYRQTNAALGTTTNIFVPIEQTLDYFGTIRGRVGAVNDNVLYYVTGGAAFGHFNQTVSLNQTGFANAKAGTTSDLIGYVVGGGIEAAIWGGWTTKVEYLFMDFGTLATVLDIAGPGGGTINTTSTIRDHVVRVGTNYRF
jgi:outer membrane immunogenic protein